MLAPDLSFISARWTVSELRERKRERHEGGFALIAPLAHWAEEGVTEFDEERDIKKDGERCARVCAYVLGGGVVMMLRWRGSYCAPLIRNHRQK